MMCGIAGWVDFERDLSNEITTIQRMTRTLTSRGPDGEGFHLTRHAALGHRRLAVIDIEGGQQPMFRGQTPQDTVTLIYTGETYNFEHLRKELAASGHCFYTASDTEVVLVGYLEWGESVVDHLNGMYSFAIWDARSEELLLVRDRIGVKPLYYYELPTGVIFGSEPKAILASQMAEPIVDADSLLELLSLVRTPGKAIFAGMREVIPGELVWVKRGGLIRRRYWNLTARQHEDDLETTVKTVRHMLEDTVGNQLISDVPLCSLLSGGLDSSVVTALAQRQLTRNGRGLMRSFTVDFISTNSEFHPNEMRVESDLPFVNEFVESIGTDHTRITIDNSEIADPLAWQATLTARDLPPLGDMDTSLYLMCKAIRPHATVALSGEGADELFGGYPWFHDLEVVTTPSFPWLVSARRLGRQAVFEPRLRRGLNIAAYQAERYAQAMAEAPRLAGETAIEQRMREISYLHLTRFLPNPLDRKDRLSMAVGLEIRVPYCDHRLVEYMFNVPWAVKTFDGREKSLLRAAARGLIPESIAQRVKTAFPTTHDPGYHKLLRDAVSKLLRDGTAPVLSILSRSTMRALAAMPPSGAEVVRLGLERILRLNQWLEQYGIRVEL